MSSAAAFATSSRPSSPSDARSSLRVLLLTPDFLPAAGGIQLLMHRLASNLDADVRVLTLGTEGAGRFDAVQPFDVVRVASKTSERNKLAVGAFNIAAIREGLARRPDVVISGHAVAAPAAATLRRVTGAQVLQYLHSGELRRRRTLTRFALRDADRVVAVSRYSRELALATGIDPEKVRVVNLGVDPAPDTPVERAERPTVLTVARLQDEWRGHDAILRALPIVRDRVPDVEWVVIGDGPLRARLERMAEDLGVAESVRFLGQITDERRSERDRWYARAWLFAMPTRLPDAGIGGEAFGIAYLEAGTFGLPVVAGDAGGAVDAVIDGETGVLVDGRDHRAVAEAIGDLLVDRERARWLGAGGARRAAELTWERHANEVGRLVDELVRS